ncbi:MAG: cyanophycinase [Bryobacteraceae bacterium]
MKEIIRIASVVAAIAALVPANEGKGASGFALMGGGSDQDAAFRWMCERTLTGKFVILRASGTDAYNPYIRNVCPILSSVETLLITSREQSGQPAVTRKIRDAGALFIAGGSQDNYVNFWQGTPVEDAINAVIAKGAPVGGTSAGLAVLGQYAFAALNDTIHSKEALQNPFDRRVTITRDFLHVPHLEGKITDSHFVARDRMGRLIVFLARISQDGWTRTPYGIGIDEKTALLMEASGSALVEGKGAVYFLHPHAPPEECRPNAPLTYKDVSVYRLSAGAGQFDVASWKGSGGTAYTLSVRDGVLTSSQVNGEIY